MADEVEKSGSKSDEDDENEDDDDEDEEEEEDGESDGELLYNSKEYENLVVGSDVRQVFSYIGLYTPRVMELELKLKPFIPDLMPAVGDTDAFIKVSAGSCQSGCQSGGCPFGAAQNSLQVISLTLCLPLSLCHRFP
jgi:hypothetical protein